MNELINLFSAGGLGIQNIYGSARELLGGLTTTTAGATASGGCCPNRCTNRCTNSCIMPLTQVASAVDEVTYDVTVSSFVDVPMRVINFCPGKARSCRSGCGCCCCCKSGSSCGSCH